MLAGQGLALVLKDDKVRHVQGMGEATRRCMHRGQDPNMRPKTQKMMQHNQGERERDRKKKERDRETQRKREREEERRREREQARKRTW